jgi:hypothetical protein
VRPATDLYNPRTTTDSRTPTFTPYLSFCTPLPLPAIQANGTMSQFARFCCVTLSVNICLLPCVDQGCRAQIATSPCRADAIQMQVPEIEPKGGAVRCSLSLSHSFNNILAAWQNCITFREGFTIAKTYCTSCGTCGANLKTLIPQLAPDS